MKIIFAVLLILILFVGGHAQDAKPSDEQVVIQALQGQIQFLAGQLELLKRGKDKSDAQLKDAQEKCKPEKEAK